MRGLDPCIEVACPHCGAKIRGWAAKRNLRRHEAVCKDRTPAEREKQRVGRMGWKRLVIAAVAMALASCAHDVGGTVVLRNWSRQIVEEEERCSTELMVITSGNSTTLIPYESCHWDYRKAWTLMGGDDVPPRWPDTPGKTVAKGIRHTEIPMNIVAFYGGMELQVSDADYVRMLPGTVWRCRSRFGRALSVEQVHVEGS